MALYAICPDRVTAETKAFASQWNLFKDFFIPRHYFNQLDTVSKVMY